MEKEKNTELFRRKFLELENAIIHEEDNDIKLYEKIKELRNKRREPFFSQFDFINFCRECRNRLSHKGYENDFIIYSDEMINKLEKTIYEIKHPYKILDKATKNVFSANLNDNVRCVMLEMEKKNYTHIPIYNNKKLVGVFSEGALFNYLYKEQIVSIKNDMSFNDIIDIINIDNSKEMIKFVDRNKLYDEVCAEFLKEFKKGSKLSCVLITQNGKTNETVLGILTSWDIIGR